MRLCSVKTKFDLFFCINGDESCCVALTCESFPSVKNALGAQIGQLQRRGFRLAPGTLLHADVCN